MEKIGLLERGGLATESQAGTPGGWTFTYDKKATTSDELISMIAEQTGKNKMLVAADLSSFFEQAREFINTGKAFEIEGAGFIKSVPGSLYQLVSYESIGEIVKKVKSSASATNRSTGMSKTGEKAAGFVSFLIIAVILGALGWGIYQFFFAGNKGDKTSSETLSQPVTDTTASNVPADQGSSSAIVSIKPGDSVNFKFVIEVTPNKTRAVSRTAQLKSFGNPAYYDSIKESAGSAIYHIYLLKKATISDTVAIKDSLTRFFIPKSSNKKIIIKL